MNANNIIEGIPFKHWLNQVAAGRTLREDEAERVVEAMMTGAATPAQMGAFLMALRVRGETVEEISGAARAMRAQALTITAPSDAIDTCGTGGDASGSFNISTAAAFVLAACGVKVAKHGNRALSSKSGSAEVLSALGVNIDADLSLIERTIAEIGIGFLMAPRHHVAMRHVGPVRVELGTRTLFNLLGPLANPAGVRRQLIGVYGPQWVRPFAEVLKRLGSEACWIVHGEGLDELTTTGISHVAQLKDGEITTFTLRPEDAGLPRADIEALRGGDPEHNAKLMRDLFAGSAGPLRNIVLLNAAAGLIVAGRTGTLPEGMRLAADALESGEALRVLDRLVAFTNGRNV